jgi:zinc transport system substrate-binding protein
MILNRMRIVLMRAVLVPAVCLVAGLSGCAAFSTAPPATDGLRVAAAFYPLAFVAESIGGDEVTVTNLTRPGVEPHDLELTIAETAEVAQADLLLVEDGFQPAVDDAVAQNATGRVLDAGTLTKGGDPHFWLDPTLMGKLAEQVADELSKLDPEHARDFEGRAQLLGLALAALDTKYRTGLELAQCDRHTVVVSHDAFSYLSRYGLEFEPIAGLSPDAEPTPADLGRLQQLVEDEGITTVFTERLASPRLAETLAHDLGIRTAVLDPVEGLVPDEVDGAGEDTIDYLSLMRENLLELRKANQCR